MSKTKIHKLNRKVHNNIFLEKKELLQSYDYYLGEKYKIMYFSYLIWYVRIPLKILTMVFPFLKNKQYFRDYVIEKHHLSSSTRENHQLYMDLYKDNKKREIT